MNAALIFRVYQEEDIDRMISGAESYDDKQKRVRDLFAALNGLLAHLFAAINVAERQIAAL